MSIFYTLNQRKAITTEFVNRISSPLNVQLTIFCSFAVFDGLFGNSKVAFIRWLYTDILVLNNDDDMCDTLTSLLTAAHVYKLPKLFERCEKAIVEQLDITTCAKYHNHAMGTGAKTVMKHCKQLIQSYWNGLRSPNFFKIDMESEADSGNSLCVETVSNVSIQTRPDK